MYETQERAKRITDIHVLWGQSTVIEELIQAGKIDEEYIYPFNGDEVLEWWLVTPWLAERLKEQGEIIIDELGCRWWGRLTRFDTYGQTFLWKNIFIIRSWMMSKQNNFLHDYGCNGKYGCLVGSHCTG